jgi:Putative peptidoglycan binding domain
MGRTHVVEQGERLATIAAQYGISPAVIYADPDNAQLWEKRPNPNVLMPGDEVSLGDPSTPTDFPTGGAHTIMIDAGQNETVRILLGSRCDVSFAGQQFELKVGGQTIQGTVPDDNVVAGDFLLGAESGELRLWISDDPAVIASWTLQIGHLDPVNEISGVQARLNNLGYGAGEVDGNSNPDLDGAVAALQRDLGAEPTGEIDDDFRAALDEAHDGQKFPPDPPPPPDPSDESFEFEYEFDTSDDSNDSDDGDDSDDSAAPTAGGDSGESADDEDDLERVDDDGYVTTGEDQDADNDDGSDDDGDAAA